MLVKDYSSMLNFIARGSSIIMLFCFSILYNNSEFVSDLFVSIPNYKIEINQIPINTNYIIPVILWYIISYYTRFHDKISDIFKIRRHFDYQYILLPISNEVGLSLKSEDRDKLKNSRGKLMGKIFYKYVDSTSPKISKHNIYNALTNWAIYWFLIESLTILTVFLIGFLFLKLFGYSLILALLIISFNFLSIWFYRKAIKNVDVEIKLIFELDDSEISNDIKKEITNAL